jgi:hypothetical protein
VSKPTQPLNAAQKNAQHYFRKADLQPDALAKQTRKKERMAGAANTARLRELRLAKEAEEQQAKDKLAAEQGTAAPAGQRRRPRAVKSVVRMNY